MMVERIKKYALRDAAVTLETALLELERADDRSRRGYNIVLTDSDKEMMHHIARLTGIFRENWEAGDYDYLLKNGGYEKENFIDRMIRTGKPF